MTREEAIKGWIIPAIKNTWNEKKCKEIIEALEQEPLTDAEQRIFLAAMVSEEKFCRKFCADGYGANGDGVDLVRVCREIKRKVKKALWE